MAKIFIICGHGAGDPGAAGNGYTEAERVRALAARIKALGGNNVMIGDTSRNWYADNGISSLSISKKYQIVELHMDSDATSARGGHVVIDGCCEPDAYDTALADFISGVLPGRSDVLVERTDLANPKRATAKGYSYRLIECGFISNAEDVKIFNDKMDEIASGILKVFEIATAGWKKNVVGWWYQRADGSYPAKNWEKINNRWYWFDSRGYMVTGWKQISGTWYYFDVSGAMKTGWLLDKSNWFYLGADGKMCENQWIKDNGNWYWLKAGGYMAKNEVLKIDGKTYAFMEDGRMATKIGPGGAIS